MNEHGPKAVVLAHYAALAARDRDAAMATLAADIQWDAMGPSIIPFAGSRRGRAAVGEFFSMIRELVDVEEFTLTRVIEDGDTVVAFGRERFRVKGTGRAWDVDWVQVHRVANGEITHFREFTDTAAIAAAFEE